MKLNKILLLTGVTVAFAGQADALTIVRNFTGGTASANQNGGGSLSAIFNAAADVWEAAIGDAHVVTLSFGWANLGSGTLGQQSCENLLACSDQSHVSRPLQQ